ncbi:uncharacterized protein BKA78DRAFT_355326 [Phyllosticta capitalensis]|uniref:uncharacterized protein n=1 Tax=Phyllosticta capitalensis TaxID=121624 RepID=UPI0031308ED0
MTPTPTRRASTAKRPINMNPPATTFCYIERYVQRCRVVDRKADPNAKRQNFITPDSKLRNAKLRDAKLQNAKRQTPKHLEAKIPKANYLRSPTPTAANPRRSDLDRRLVADEEVSGWRRDRGREGSRRVDKTNDLVALTLAE